MNFELVSDYQPTGDQPEAIAQLTEGVKSGVPAQTLLGVTGSGKTFTIANVIKNINKPPRGIFFFTFSHNYAILIKLFQLFFDRNSITVFILTKERDNLC